MHKEIEHWMVLTVLKVGERKSESGTGSRLGSCCHIVEPQRSSHGSGYICSEGTNLGVNVTVKGIGGPSAKLPDGVIRESIEFESHGSRSSEAVGAHFLQSKTR